MSCQKCIETDYIATGAFTLPNGTRIFTDLRFDVENKELDMKFGTVDENGIPYESDWSDAADISFCPFCGTKLD